MKKTYTLSIILLSILSFGQTPISLIGVNVPYNEDFSGMGASGTDFLPGWTAINTLGGATLSMAVSDGSASTGNIYNVGNTASEERAFGTLADGTTIPAFGAVFTNNSGNTVSKIAIQTKMEQWRESSDATVNETVAFSYSLNATGLNDGTWTPVTVLDLKEKLTSATTNLAVNGNLASNYTLLSNIISGINWANGTNLWIKWSDANEAGNNGLYAIDNFSLSISEVLGVKPNTITGLNIYPNPVTNGKVYITSKNDSNKEVVIFDETGKKALQTTISSNELNVSSLTPGIFIIKITSGDESSTRKLIIK